MSAVASLEAVLRLSVIQRELNEIAEGLDPRTAQIVRYAARVLNLLRSASK